MSAPVQVPQGDWVRQANCRGVNSDVFFPPIGASTSDAKKICGRCDVRAECLDYALRAREHWGIWGGTSERDRRRMRRARGRAAS